MPRSNLTAEQKKLIDFDEITPDRHDFALVLFCSRIIVRIQIKCFEETETFSNDINNIVRKEAESFSERLQGFIDQLKESGHPYNLSAMTMDFKDK
ncbi:hypothetical protein RclHR1_07830009 [Rhizophagus clarus]|nr:hypothetical protein RclHR1_07830009 [Rhizophagus clarus]